MKKLLGALALAALLAACIDAPPAATGERPQSLGNTAGAVTPGVAPRHSKPHGKTYEEWGAAMLQWVGSTPASVNQFIDATGAYTEAANSGPVWFFMGPSELLGQPQAGSITMPAGTAIFFSPLALYAVGPGGNDGDGDDTPEELAGFVDWLVSLIGGVSVEIDGNPVVDVEQYRVISPVVPIDPPEDNPWSGLFGAPNPWTFGQFGGFGLFINPLPPGEHVIHAVAGVPDFGLFFEITYYITVEPRN